MLTALRIAKNRSYPHVLIYVLMLSLVSSLVSATCAMPSVWRSQSADLMPEGCPESSGHSMHKDHSSDPVKDCSFKPCLDSQLNQASGYKLDNPEIPFAVLNLLWLLVLFISYARAKPVYPVASPPDGRRIPLIYRYCILLN